MVAMAKKMEDTGAHCAVATPPLIRQNMPMVLTQFIRHSPLPVVIYNIPEVDNFDLKTIFQELCIQLGVIGWKESTSATKEMRRLASSISAFKPDFAWMTGKENQIFQAMFNGRMSNAKPATGAVCSMYHMGVAPFVRLFQAIRKKRWIDAKQIQYEHIDPTYKVYSEGLAPPGSSQQHLPAQRRRGGNSIHSHCRRRAGGQPAPDVEQATLRGGPMRARLFTFYNHIFQYLNGSPPI